MNSFFQRIPWQTIVNNSNDYKILTDTTTTLSILSALAALLLSLGIAQYISWRPDKSDYGIRKKVYYLILIVIVVIFWSYNYFHVSTYIDNNSLNLKFSSFPKGHIYINIVYILTIYLLFGYLGAKIFSKSKFASIFQ